MTRESIIEKVRLRIQQYEEDEAKNRQLQGWYERMFQPTIKRLDLGCWPWEAAVERIMQGNSEAGKQIQAFYTQCLTYNQKT